jgi:hypothetical protein
MERSSGNLLAYEVSGEINKEEYEIALDKLKRAIDEHGKIELLINQGDIEGLEPGVIWEDLKFTFRYSGDISRLAVVGDRDWHRRLTETGGSLLPPETRFFERNQLEKAWNWLRA